MLQRCQKRTFQMTCLHHLPVQHESLTVVGVSMWMLTISDLQDFSVSSKTDYKSFLTISDRVSPFQKWSSKTD